MMSEGFAILSRIWILVAAVALIGFIVYTMIRLWSDTSLGQRFFGVGLVFLELAIIDYTWESIYDGVGWKWRLLLLIIGQIAFVGYFFEPLRQRKLNRIPLLKKMGKEHEIR